MAYRLYVLFTIYCRLQVTIYGINFNHQETMPAIQRIHKRMKRMSKFANVEKPGLL